MQGLETTEYQISRFDGLPMNQQERFLAESLKDLDAEKASVQKIAGAWKTGHRLMVAVSASPLSESLIRWTRRMAC